MSAACGTSCKIDVTNVYQRKFAKRSGKIMMNRLLLVPVAMMAMCAFANAQESYTVDEIAKVQNFEIVRFIPSSVSESRGERRFDVLIRYADPDESPAGGAASRKVGYRARCEAGELAISTIVLRNVNAQMIKVITVPPGGEEFFRPDPSSHESDWIYRVCG